MARRGSTTRIRSGDRYVNVEGLAELQKALRSLPKELRRDLTRANRMAASLVAQRARSRAIAQGSTAAHAAPSIRASATQTSAGVAIGGGSHPEALGAEFGSLRFKQFKPWLGSGPDAGYFLYPTIRNDEGAWIEPYEDLIDTITRKAGLR